MEGEDAKKLVELCPMDVFDIEDLGKSCIQQFLED